MGTNMGFVKGTLAANPSIRQSCSARVGKRVGQRFQLVQAQNISWRGL